MNFDVPCTSGSELSLMKPLLHVDDGLTIYLLKSLAPPTYEDNAVLQDVLRLLESSLFVFMLQESNTLLV